MSIREKGALYTGGAWFPCIILDMSDSGFLILCNQRLSVGQVLDFRCELFPGKTLECQIEIRHIGESGMGTKIREIDEKGRRLCQLYLQEQYSLKLNSKSR